ncbi:hypothetical protein ABBQ38_014250 [Trebouxia sp. C0009 RCD-2024]
MQQLSRRGLARAGLARIACQATGSQSSASSCKTVVEPKAQHTVAQCFSTSCIRTPVKPTANSSSTCSKPFRLHQGHYETFVTKAEEYDLIVAEAGLVRIEGYDDTGFIVNDVQVQGAVFLIGDLFTMWNVKSWQEVEPDSLSMLQLYKPAPDLVILGCGRRSQMVPPKLRTYFQQHKIAYEAIDTANAVSTFNILNQEGRKVAGVLLPAGSS